MVSVVVVVVVVASDVLYGTSKIGVCGVRPRNSMAATRGVPGPTFYFYRTTQVVGGIYVY